AMDAGSTCALKLASLTLDSSASFVTAALTTSAASNLNWNVDDDTSLTTASLTAQSADIHGAINVAFGPRFEPPAGAIVHLLASDNCKDDAQFVSLAPLHGFPPLLISG